MGLLDKVKETAEKVASDAKKGAAQLQTKVEHVQLRRRADEAAKRLGYLVARERAGGTPAGEEADNLTDQIVDLEKQIAVEEAREQPSPAEASVGEEPEATPESSEGTTSS